MPTLAHDLKRNAPLALLSGLLAAVLFYPFDLWFLAPVALVPLLLALRRTHTLRAAAYLALLTGWATAVLSLHWLWSIFSTGMLAVCVLIAAPWLLFGLAYRHLHPRLSPALMILATPILFTAMEFIRCQGWYFRFSWLQPGTAYVASQASQSTYPLVGVYGMTFLTLLISAQIAHALTQPTSRRRLTALATTAATIITLTLLFRVAWLTSVGGVIPVGGSSTVGGVTDPDLPLTALMVQSETEDLDWLIATTRENANPRPSIVVWPELALTDYPADDPALLSRLQSLARDLSTTLVLGCKSHVPPGARCDWLRRRAMFQSEGALYYNSALVIAPSGDVVGSYHKRHPIQFFADGVPGPGYPVFDLPDLARLGVAICYDLDFADTALSLTRGGAQLLVVPTYDARDWGPVQQMQHARLALARAAEVGRWIIRPTSSGLSQIIAPGGEQVRFIPTHEAAPMLGVVERKGHATLYVRATWLLPYACLILSLLLLTLSLSRRPGA